MKRKVLTLGLAAAVLVTGLAWLVLRDRVREQSSRVGQKTSLPDDSGEPAVGVLGATPPPPSNPQAIAPGQFPAQPAPTAWPRSDRQVVPPDPVRAFPWRAARLNRRPDASGDEPAQNEPTVPEPVARAALPSVGIDPVAEAVWTEAINDPALTADQRQNLIEDLNEDSFPDPKHITADDLPLIVSRMQLIEDMAPNAMDEVNAAAFAEAYKDLNTLLHDLSSP